MAQEYESRYDHVDVVGDGDQLVARFHDFKDPCGSPMGFGNTDAEAIADLAYYVKCENEDLRDRMSKMR